MNKHAAAVAFATLTLNGQAIVEPVTAGDVDAVPILSVEYTYFPDGRVLEVREDGTFEMWYPAPGMPGFLFAF